MELFPFPAPSTASFFLIATLLILYLFSPTRKSKLPPGPRPWLFLGNLPFLITNSSSPHRALARLAHQYGPVLTLHLGPVPAVVISSPTLAREFLQIHGKNFSDRPYFGMAAALLYGQGKGLIFAHYGPEWRELRKLVNLELFTQKRLQDSRQVRQEEVERMIRFIARKGSEGGGCVEVKKCLAMLGGNLIGRLMMSRRLVDWETGASNELHEIVLQSNSIALTVLIGDYFRKLGWMDAMTKRRMRQIHQRLDKSLSAIVEERLRREDGGQPSSTHDFLDVLLSKTERRDKDALDSIKSLVLELFAAGIDTSSVTIEWAMAQLLQHPQELKKVQAEIEVVVAGENRLVEESDLQHLTYLQAVIKEVLRLHPAGPLCYHMHQANLVRWQATKSLHRQYCW